MFKKQYSNGMKLTVELTESGKNTVTKIDGRVLNLAEIQKLKKPIAKAGVTITHVIGGKYALDQSEYEAIREIQKEAVRNELAEEKAYWDGREKVESMQDRGF